MVPIDLRARIAPQFIDRDEDGTPWNEDETPCNEDKTPCGDNDRFFRRNGNSKKKSVIGAANRQQISSRVNVAKNALHARFVWHICT